MKANQMSPLYPEIIALALYSYEPNEEDEIPLVQGDSMIVIQQQWDGWWLVKKGDLVGLIPSTHVSLVSATTLTKSCPLPSEWDCCIDEKSGEVYYFNESTGLTQWERPVSRILLESKKSSKLRGQDRLPSLPFGEVSDHVRGSVVPKADLLRWKQLREAADLRINDLRQALTTDDGVFDIKRVNSTLRSLSNSPKKAIENLMKSRSTREHSPGISSTTILSVQSDEEKERRKSSVSIEFKDFGGKKIEKKFSHEVLHPILNDSKETLSEKVKIESVARSYKQKNEEIGFRKKKDEVDVATFSWKRDQCTTNETNLTDSSHPTVSFSLSYVNCYDGGANRYYAKNILRLNSSKIIFPAANIAIFMDTESSEQGFFTGHTDIISSLCLHPDKRIVASGQSGGLILVWDSELLQVKERMSESLIQVNTNKNENGIEESCQNIECLSFSADGVFLVALTSGGFESSKEISIFKWIDGITVASALVAHSTIQVSFDPYRNHIIENKVRSKDMGNEGNVDREVHHSLVTCGGRVIKFWTFYERCDTNRKVKINSTNCNNSIICKNEYLLEGRCGVWPGGNESSTCDLTCLTFISCHDSMMNNTNENKRVRNTSRLFCGSSTGSIFLWELTEYKKENIIQGTKNLIFKEKLLSVVTDVHEGSIFDIDYHSNVLNNHDNHDGHNNHDNLTILKDSILTCGADGMVNLWQIEKIKCSPLIHLAVYSLLGIDSDYTNIVKTVVFSNDGLNATAGTSNGSLLMLSLNSNQGDITARNILPS